MESSHKKLDFNIPVNTEITQVALLSKIVFAYNLLFDLRGTTTFDFMEHLKRDTMSESYRMLIINYLVAITGKGKHDTNSIFYNRPDAKKNKVDNFYTKHDKLLDRLRVIRNKIYAHFDNDYIENASKAGASIQFEEIKPCIEDLMSIVGYNAPVELKG